MVDKKEIEGVARLMRIRVDDHMVHVDRVQKMIEYFDLLDQAGTDSEEHGHSSVRLDALRKDEHRPFKGGVLGAVRHNKDGYVQAPRVI